MDPSSSTDQTNAPLADAGAAGSDPVAMPVEPTTPVDPVPVVDAPMDVPAPGGMVTPDAPATDMPSEAVLPEPAPSSPDLSGLSTPVEEAAAPAADAATDPTATGGTDQTPPQAGSF